MTKKHAIKAFSLIAAIILVVSMIIPLSSCAILKTPPKMYTVTFDTRGGNSIPSQSGTRVFGNATVVAYGTAVYKTK